MLVSPARRNCAAARLAMNSTAGTQTASVRPLIRLLYILRRTLVHAAYASTPDRAFGVAAVPGEDRQQRFDICQRRAEVHDARAQGEPAIDHGVRQERLAAPLDARQQLLIHTLQIRLGVRRLRQVARDVAERRDAELLRHRLEVRMLLDERVQM